MAQRQTIDERFPVRGTDGRFPLRASIPPSCPSGYTASDLEEVFGDRLPAFNKWMFGQTMMICDGRSYRYNRAHTGKCTPECEDRSVNAWPNNLRECFDHCNHNDDDGFDWKCDYLPGGEHEDTACAGHPHGVVVYRWDVERYIESLVTGRPAVWD